jgi:hypothetical protein
MKVANITETAMSHGFIWRCGSDTGHTLQQFGHLAIWPSGHFAIWPIRHLAIDHAPSHGELTRDDQIRIFYRV